MKPLWLLLEIMTRLESPLNRLRDRLIFGVQVEEDGCWTWQKATNGKGYGRIKFLGRLWSTHRLSYRLFVGPIPKGHDVCHRCDRPSCIRPGHLFAGTRSENMQDAAHKGRLSSKLTPADVRAIRAQSDFETGPLAKAYDVSPTTIRDIKNHRTWKGVNNGEEEAEEDGPGNQGSADLT